MSNLPAWAELAEADRAQVVRFLRTAADEGTSYAWEEYRPEWPAGSALNNVQSGEALHRAYGEDYEALDDDAFWRLYEMADQAEDARERQA